MNPEKMEKTYNGFPAELVDPALDAVLKKTDRMDKFGIHASQIAQEVGKREGFNPETVQHFIRAISVAGTERRNLHQAKAKARTLERVERDRRLQLQETHKLAAERGDEDISEEDLHRARGMPTKPGPVIPND